MLWDFRHQTNLFLGTDEYCPPEVYTEVNLNQLLCGLLESEPGWSHGKIAFITKR